MALDSFARTYPYALGHFFVVVHGLLTDRRMRDEEARIVTARRAAGCDPVREVHERGDLEPQSGIP